MRCSVITAGRLHHDHIAAVERIHGAVTIDRRCADIAELVAAARAGWADAALVIGETEVLTATLLHEISERGLVVVAVSDVPEERTRLRRLGIAALPDNVATEILIDALRGMPAPDVETTPSHPEGVADSDCASSASHGPDAAPSAASRGTGQDQGRGQDQRRGQDQPVPPGADPLDAELADLIRSAEHPPAEDSATVPDRGPDVGPVAERDQDRGHLVGDAVVEEVHGDQWTEGFPHAEGTELEDSEAVRSEEEIAGSSQDTRLTGITTVWGAPGSPGRTTLAVNLAAELALAGGRVMLIDADTIASSVATHLGLLEESAGLAQACRQADLGRLDSMRLWRAATRVDICGSRLHLLTGLPRPDRWPELRQGALRRVIELSAEDFDHVVIDVAAATEQDEELTFDTLAPQRNAATVVAVEEAQTLFALGAPDPVAFPRLVKSLEDLRLNVPQAPAPRVLINQTRRDVVGRAPEEQLREAWARFGPAEPLETFLPWDRAACDEALLTGRVLAEAAPQSPLRRSVAELAGAELPTRRRRRLRR
ncbi:AAA family ATPase [Nesterenkonia suensis]